MSTIELHLGASATSRLINHLVNLPSSLGRRPNGFLELSLNDRTILFLVNLLYKTVSVG